VRLTFSGWMRSIRTPILGIVSIISYSPSIFLSLVLFFCLSFSFFCPLICFLSLALLFLPRFLLLSFVIYFMPRFRRSSELFVKTNPRPHSGSQVAKTDHQELQFWLIPEICEAFEKQCWWEGGSISRGSGSSHSIVNDRSLDSVNSSGSSRSAGRT
jgi:hypothetical protein